MIDHASEWLSLVVRWIHVITGVAWIGTSFYFNWLNNNIRPPETPKEGVEGELWSIHGGHFYTVQKYSVAPEKLPETLHWFKYEAYFTWISGFTLLCIVYYLDTSVYLVDERVMSMSSPMAIGVGVGTLVVGWVVYHYMCKSPLGRMPVTFALVGFALMVGVAHGLVELFGSRAAYIHVGALIGTMMAWNVFFVIIPNQKKTVATMVDRKDPDPVWNRDAAQRSLHNNYFTLPVLFIMVSSHYPFTFGHAWNWAILAALSLIGAGVRHWFNLRGKGQRNVWLLPAAAAGIVALALVSAPRSYADHRPVSFAEVRTVIEERCITCHSQTPTHEAFQVAPQGVMLDTPQQIRDQAARINSQVVVTDTMPLGNVTNMTQEERDLIGAWFYQGAKVE